MGSWPPADDDPALLTGLGEALRAPGPVPEEFLAAARGAFAWRTVDEDLSVAELTFDSACDAEPAGLTRSGGSARTLSFRTDSVVVVVEVSEDGIVGQLSPPGVAGSPSGPRPASTTRRASTRSGSSPSPLPHPGRYGCSPAPPTTPWRRAGSA